MSSVNIVIPTYNRATQINHAVDAALGQSHSQTLVTVIDDGSIDETLTALGPYLDHPRFRCIALESNVGTAQAKNVGIAFNDCDYITFHDSDDVPHVDKIARQIAVADQSCIKADRILNWQLVGTSPGSTLEVDLVVNEHTLVCADGTRHHIRRALSLVDDMFPNLQMAAGVPGDWILINCGLFRTTVFDQLGGFKNCIEEDRDLRNRLIFDGRILWLMPEILMSKYECADSLTVDTTTNYDSVRRVQERQSIWREAEAFAQGKKPEPVPIQFDNLALRYISSGLTLSSALMTSATQEMCMSALHRGAADFRQVNTRIRTDGARIH